MAHVSTLFYQVDDYPGNLRKEGQPLMAFDPLAWDEYLDNLLLPLNLEPSDACMARILSQI
ncbi:MAG: hypothetical protein R2751_15335 [Bacteroidales bacterium]